MNFVLTLISRPADRAVEDSTINAARSALEAAGSAPGRTPGRTDVLAPGVACDIHFESDDAAAAGETEEEVRRRLRGLPVDLAVQPLEGRRKRLLAADMESTLIENEMLDELAAMLDSGGEMGARVAALTARAMRGEIDFREALRQRVALLEGQPASLLDDAVARIVLTPGAETLAPTMRGSGAYNLMLSGGFDPFTEWVRGRLGFDRAVGNRLELEDGRITGRVAEPVLDREGKLETLRQVAGERGIPLSETIAVGDGANDLPMLTAAGIGVAFHAKPVVAEAARVRIDHGDLTALLYLQGYRAEEIKSAY